MGDAQNAVGRLVRGAWKKWYEQEQQHDHNIEHSLCKDTPKSHPQRDPAKAVEQCGPHNLPSVRGEEIVAGKTDKHGGVADPEAARVTVRLEESPPAPSPDGIRSQEGDQAQAQPFKLRLFDGVPDCKRRHTMQSPGQQRNGKGEPAESVHHTRVQEV
jgi:hypothetical protein